MAGTQDPPDDPMPVIDDSSILALCSKGLIISENFQESCLTPNGYDLRIGDIRTGNSTYTTEVEVPPGRHFLVSTLEYLNLPAYIMAEIWIRSSYARMGVIGSFGAVDAGFRGNLTLSFYNASENRISLRRGDRIAQIVFHQMSGTAEKSYGERSGHYQDSRGVTVKGSDAL